MNLSDSRRRWRCTIQETQFLNLGVDDSTTWEHFLCVTESTGQLSLLKWRNPWGAPPPAIEPCGPVKASASSKSVSPRLELCAIPVSGSRRFGPAASGPRFTFRWPLFAAEICHWPWSSPRSSRAAPQASISRIRFSSAVSAVNRDADPKLKVTQTDDNK
jgi:hypothetical protein